MPAAFRLGHLNYLTWRLCASVCYFSSRERIHATSLHSINLQLRVWFKGADTTVVLKFLACYLEHNAPHNDEYLQCLLRCCQAANKFLSLLYHAELWLPRRTARMVVRAGRDYILLYKSLAKTAYEMRLTRYLLTPKLHLFMHCIHILEQQIAAKVHVVNPLSDSCQMCEDFINKVSTLGRNVSPRKFCEATLKQYMLCVHKHW